MSSGFDEDDLKVLTAGGKLNGQPNKQKNNEVSEKKLKPLPENQVSQPLVISKKIEEDLHENSDDGSVYNFDKKLFKKDS